jgi:glycosyltransferase involved in cell wall biosynthesis
LRPELISIMMPAYNAEAYIGPAIESVLAQSYTNWELVVVDDGSVDRTFEIASKYGDSRIKLFKQANQGEAAARNTALRIADGEYLAFLDADDLYLPHHLESMVGYLLPRPQVDGVYSDGYYIDQNGKELQALSSRRRGPFEGDVFEEVVYSSDVFGPPACVMLRTNVIDKHGLKFDENIIIGPDWDFFTQYADLAKFGYIDQTTCLYRLHVTNISVRTSLEKRASELSKCRINAIKMKSFDRCSFHVRTAVFYDLLVNLLVGFPEKQSAIIEWPKFKGLPGHEQARLLRLMASKTMIHAKDYTSVQNWLNRARQLNGADKRTQLLWLLFQIHPKLLRVLLKIKGLWEVDPRTVPPFADMKISQSG